MRSSIDPKDIFDHEFDGYSIWLEPDYQLISDLAEETRELCGGSSVGCDPFVPHCTLLYNFPVPEGADDSEFFEKQLKSALRMAKLENQSIALDPTSFYFFHYPKEADEGKGFGCVISMFLLKKTAALERLHEALSSTFPIDERKGNFQPHMALVYAPESKMDFLRRFTEDELSRRRENLLETPFFSKRISVWKTKGRLKDWARVASVEL